MKNVVSAITIDDEKWVQKLTGAIRDGKVNISTILSDEISPTLAKDKSEKNLLVDGECYHGKKDYYVKNGLKHDKDELYLGAVDKADEIDLLGNPNVPGMFWLKPYLGNETPIFIDGEKVAKALELPYHVSQISVVEDLTVVKTQLVEKETEKHKSGGLRPDKKTRNNSNTKNGYADGM